MDDKMNVVTRCLEMFEKELFTGSFSESNVRKDLQHRKAMDMYSTMGSSGRQTNELSQKKRVYIDNFTEDIQVIKAAQSHLVPSHPYYSRLERCKKQAEKLIDIVSNF